jgi:hypothetical protein
MKIIFFFIGFIFFNANAQVLHHQTFVSQGKNMKISNGYFLGQSIGQNSPSGTFKNSEMVVQQGFQQYVITRYSIKSSTITTIVYPNPFIADLNFEFSQIINDQIQVLLYDLSGRLVKSIFKKSADKVLSVDFGDVSEGHYFVLLSVGDYRFSTKVIKINKL